MRLRAGSGFGAFRNSSDGDMKLICSRCGEEIILDDSPVPFEFEPVDTGPICDRCRQTDVSRKASGRTPSLAP